MIPGKMVQTSKVVSREAMKGLLFIAGAIGMNIGNPFEAAKRMVRGDFDALKGKTVSIFIIGKSGDLQGQIKVVRKGYVIIQSDHRVFYVNMDRIEYIEEMV